MNPLVRCIAITRNNDNTVECHLDDNHSHRYSEMFNLEQATALYNFYRMLKLNQLGYCPGKHN